jgi:hypothetical protein
MGRHFCSRQLFRHASRAKLALKKREGDREAAAAKLGEIERAKPKHLLVGDQFAVVIRLRRDWVNEAFSFAFSTGDKSFTIEKMNHRACPSVCSSPHHRD